MSRPKFHNDGIVSLDGVDVGRVVQDGKVWTLKSLGGGFQYGKPTTRRSELGPAILSAYKHATKPPRAASADVTYPTGPARKVKPLF